MTKLKLLTAALVFALVAFATPVLAVDYNIPMWDSAQGTGANGNEYAPGDGSTWYLGNTTYGSLKVNVKPLRPSSLTSNVVNSSWIRLRAAARLEALANRTVNPSTLASTVNAPVCSSRSTCSISRPTASIRTATASSRSTL